MLFWSWQQWLLQPWRAIAATLVYASVLALTMLFDGIHVGILKDLRNFPASLPADLVAFEAGNTSFSLSPSKLPQLARAQAENVPGVTDAQPIFLFPFIFIKDGERTPSMLVVFNQAGGPQKILVGRPPTIGREVVLDASLARLHEVRVGERTSILGYDVTVVGLSSGTSSPFTPYSFMTYDRLIDMAVDLDLLFATDEFSMVSALLIKVDQPRALPEIRRNLEDALPFADISTPAELGDADADFGERMIGPVLFLISGIAWLITFLTMSILRYAEVRSHLRQFGIQKALGASPVWLASVLALGGLWIVLGALPLSVLLAKGLAWLTSEWNPLYDARVWAMEVLARGVAVAFIASLAGSLLSLRKLVKLEPAIVFKR